MEKEKLRSQISNEYYWSIDKMYESEASLENDLEKLNKLTEQLLSYKNHIMESSNNLYEFYQTYEALNRVIEKVYVYSHMKCDEDTKNINAQALKMKVDKQIEGINERTSFITPEMLKIPYEVVLQYIQENEKLIEYEFDLEKVYRYQKHVLSEREEEIVTMAANSMGSSSEVFYNLNNADIYYGEVKDEEGNLKELTNANYNLFMNSSIREVRKSAFEKMYQYWSSIKNTVASTLKGKIKEDFFFSKIYKYDSPLISSLYRDSIDKQVYLNLIDTVHNNLNKMYEYMNVRRKMLGLDELHMYDMYVDLVSENQKKISYEEGKQIIFKALEPLGEQYIFDLKNSFNQKWIDVYPSVGKKSGAYSWGVYDSFPYILLNYNDTIDSVSTMAHELGHSMHSYYSIQKQSYTYHSYPIFLAEIASTVNEVLLNNYLYKNASSKEEKILYLTEMLDKIRTTLYRQTMFAEFEMIMHDKEEKGIPLTEQEFSDTYYKLNKEYYGSDVISDELIQYEWAKIPHFYTPFYVYKYATGISAAIAIATDIINEVPGVREKYLEFLSSGDNDYPLNILKKTGVDMTTTEPIQKALDLFSEKLEELKKLSEI